MSPSFALFLSVAINNTRNILHNILCVYASRKFISFTKIRAQDYGVLDSRTHKEHNQAICTLRQILDFSQTILMHIKFIGHCIILIVE